MQNSPFVENCNEILFIFMISNVLHYSYNSWGSCPLIKEYTPLGSGLACITIVTDVFNCLHLLQDNFCHVVSQKIPRISSNGVVTLLSIHEFSSLNLGSVTKHADTYPMDYSSPYSIPHDFNLKLKHYHIQFLYNLLFIDHLTISWCKV